MKRLILALVFSTSFTILPAKIRNGYEKDIKFLKPSIQKITSILRDERNMSPEQERNVYDRLDYLFDYESYYELTETLIAQLKVLSPILYDQIDNIKDKKGRSVDVYVKFIPEEQSNTPLCGVSFFGRSAIDEDAHQSEYGEHSVSVKIWIVGNAMMYLYHELGHIKYIVPNLAAYAKTYTKACKTNSVDMNHIGHRAGDPSGWSAGRLENQFLKDRFVYKKKYGERLAFAPALLRSIRESKRIHIREFLLPLVARQ